MRILVITKREAKDKTNLDRRRYGNVIEQTVDLKITKGIGNLLVLDFDF